MNQRMLRLSCLMSASAFAVAVATPVFAQAQAEPNAPSASTGSRVTTSPSTPEIVVTAQFRSERLQDTPLAITAITSESLQQRNQVNVVDIAANAPNITVLKGGSGYGLTPSISIRGIGAGDYNFAISPAVGVYVDDVYMPTLFGSASDLVDIDRVEVLRGPQGTLSGKNSEGGSIKIFSKAPDNDFGGNIEAGYGSYNAVRVRGAINIPIVQDRLALRLTGAYSREDGYVTRLDYGCLNPGSGVAAVTTASNCKLGKEGGSDHRGIRGQLRWTPSDALQVDLSADYTRIDDEPAATKLIYARNSSGIPQTDFAQFLTSGRFTNYETYCVAELGYCQPAVAKAKPWGVSGRIKYDINDTLSLTSITAYRAYTARFTSDGDGGPLTALQQDNQLKYRTFTQELRLNGTNGPIDWTVGGYYSKDRGVQAGRQNVGYVGFPPMISDFDQHDVVTAGSIAGFVHGVYHATDKLNLTLGYRYTHDKRDYTFNRSANTPGAALAAAIDGMTGRFRGNSNDYRATLDYHVSDAVMTYATFSTGFRGGGINPRPFTESQIKEFGAEKLYNFEVGAKANLFDRRLTLNASAFYDLFRDIQETITSGYGGFPISAIPLNSGNAKLKGVELELNARPVPGLQIDGSVSYIDFQFTKLSADAISSGITMDMTSPFTPKWKASLGVQYEIPLGSIGTLTPRLDVNYQSSLYTQAVNTSLNRLQPFTVMNAQLTYAPNDKNWSLAVSVTNLTNKYYYLNIDDTYQGTGTTRATPARPRTVFASIKRKF
ncbi:TonB-dependent receptor [Novosphingobium sp. Rr 2-17]|uniref:TonB-dependent receptor n=1 Tax=Novosphingobium sp. Rr 2-17 TaxID=555793 RepID=UPI0002697BAA|nr:TonB-dependent receptor [Novosphingobium sp. Rr 2-17]EIZ78342.1 TonB-dependent receptor [Novosphingobium sp. Rr 2-17]